MARTGWLYAITFIAIYLQGCTTRLPEETARRYCAYVVANKLDAMAELYAKDRRNSAKECGRVIADKVPAPNVEVIEIRKTEWGFLAPLRFTFITEDVNSPKSLIATLYMAQNGLILYDPLLVAHPGLSVNMYIEMCRDSDVTVRKGGVEMLRMLDISIQGYSPEAHQHERDLSVEKIAKWWEASATSHRIKGTTVPLSMEDYRHSVE